jgi:hypothetical protein
MLVSIRGKTLSEKITSLSIEQAYSRLKAILLKNNCKIVEENPPELITVKQGTLNGILPRSAKKVVRFHLFVETEGTKVVSDTKIADDWKYLTLFGSVFASVLVGVFVWVAMDMEKFLETAQSSYWTWLSQAFGYPDLYKTLFTINVFKVAAIFLFGTIIFEFVDVLYVYPRKEVFAHGMLEDLP